MLSVKFVIIKEMVLAKTVSVNYILTTSSQETFQIIIAIGGDSLTDRRISRGNNGNDGSKWDEEQCIKA